MPTTGITVRLKLQQVPVAAHTIIDASIDRRLEELVIIGIAGRLKHG